MSILIKGMEMPKEGCVEILIRDDGTVQQTGQTYRIDGTDYYTPYFGEMPVMYKAIPVPPHGDLIESWDIDFVLVEQSFSDEYVGKFVTTLDEINAMPVIIPAEED